MFPPQPGDEPVDAAVPLGVGQGGDEKLFLPLPLIGPDLLGFEMPCGLRRLPDQGLGDRQLPGGEVDPEAVPQGGAAPRLCGTS